MLQYLSGPPRAFNFKRPQRFPQNNSRLRGRADFVWARELNSQKRRFPARASMTLINQALGWLAARALHSQKLFPARASTALIYQALGWLADAVGWLGSIGKKASKVENLDEKLLATNDPLEAFGNAKTVHSGAPRAVGPRVFFIYPLGGLASTDRPTDRTMLGPC